MLLPIHRRFLLLGSWFIYLYAKSYPETIFIGAMAPLFNLDGTVDSVGVHCISSLILSINEINNKTDGIYDEILTKTKIKLAFRSPSRNFITATNMALQLSTAFNGVGVLGVVGPLADDASKATSQIFSYTDYKIPQISYGASSAELADKTLYPYFLRTISSVAYEGVVIAHIIKKKFQWSTVNTICVENAYGNDICQTFKKEAAIVGINIENAHTVWPGTKDFSALFSKIKSDEGILKIFVLLMSASDAAAILELGTDAGIFKEGVQIFGTQYMLTSPTWQSMSSTSKVAKIMKGIISVTPTILPNKKLYSDFVRRWRAQNNTLGHRNSDGSYTCDTTKDDDGTTYLYQGHANGSSSSPYTCAGLNFSAFAKDGSDINTLALNVYDSVVALAKGLHKLYYEDAVTSFTGEKLYGELLNLSFSGLSGQIGFDNTNVDQTSYGQGDRTQGLAYTVLNFNPYYLNTSASIAALGSAVRTIGVWKSDSMSFALCDKDTDATCSDIVYNTLDNSSPVDEAPIVEIQMGYETRVVLRAVLSLALASSLLYLSVVVAYRKHRIIKASQPAMLVVVLIGALLASIRVYIATVDITDATCIVGKWLGHLSFGLFFGAVILKTWRVSMVVNSGMKRVKVTISNLNFLLGFGLLFLTLYLLVDTLVGKPHRSYETSFDGQNTIRKVKCSSKFPQISMVLFILEGLLLFWGAKLCWSTKNVPDAVNDSRFIAMALYLIVFVCALTFPIVFLNLQPTPAMLLTIMASGFIVGTLGSTTLLFAPKLYLLLSGADVNENFEIVHESSSKKSDSSPLRDSSFKRSFYKISKFRNISSVKYSKGQNDQFPPLYPESNVQTLINSGKIHSTSQAELLKFNITAPPKYKRDFKSSQLGIDCPLKEKNGEAKSSDIISTHYLDG